VVETTENWQSRLTRFGQWAWRGVTTAKFWAVTMSLAMLVFVTTYIIFVVQPFDERPKTLSAGDVAKVWNNSIALLGIQPVYPPQEDVMVGDIWAVIAGRTQEPVLSNAVRLAHIDLRTEILELDNTRLIFPNTHLSEAGESFQTESIEVENSQNSGKRVSTSIAVFPGITFSLATKSSGTNDNSWIRLGGARNGKVIEQVRIEDVESYGAMAPQGYVQLVDWCENNQCVCENDRIARTLLADVAKDVHNQENGSYPTHIHLRLITRVFMTRKIETQRWTLDARGVVLQVGSQPVNGDVPPASNRAPRASAAAGGSALEATAKANPDPEKHGGKLSSQFSERTEMGINGVFQRPLVFGFRSIGIELKPSPPQNTTAALNEHRLTKACLLSSALLSVAPHAGAQSDTPRNSTTAPVSPAPSARE
jgi:hypothetical protein